MQTSFRQTRQIISSFPRSLRPSKKTILLILAVAAITLLLSTIISILLTRIYNLDLPGSIGTIKTVGVEAYWDKNLTDKIDENDTIDWGTLWLGSSNNITIYLLSISNINTTLKLTKNLTEANLTFYDTKDVPLQANISDHIQPLPDNISDYMHLDWNYDESTVLQPGDSIQVTLTLQAEYDRDFIDHLIEYDVKSFSLDIHIYPPEYAA